MFRVLIIVQLLLFAVTLSAQHKYNYAKADSISYEYFKQENWDKLITSTELMLKQGIDSKHLRQRLAYAHFVKTNYAKAAIQYTRAYEFDKSDLLTISYLYYSYLKLGNQTLAQFYAQKLPKETQEELHLKSFRWINAIDFEYNYKTAYSDIRTAPNFLRLGFNSQLGYRWNYYQTISNYKQIFYTTYHTTQNEYFGLLNFTATNQLSLLAGYHYIHTNIDSSVITSAYKSHMFIGKAVYRLNRLNLGLSYSNFDSNSSYSNQLGLQFGALLPGKQNIYLSSALFHLSDATTNRWVFNQTAGMLMTKKLWVEANVTLGNLKNFVDLNGLYVYNSLDPTTFRTGLSLYYYLNKHFTLYSNYTFSEKNIEYNNKYYNQHSITGGIIWKF